MNPKTQAVIVSCEGPVLTHAERDFFNDYQPFGFILFGRNVVDRPQLRRLCADLRESVGWHCPVLIDQEGGRVRRMRPPVWPDYPSMKEIGDTADEARLREVIAGIAADLNDVGIDVDCAPVLDVLFAQTHAAIGDRAFSEDPALVGRLGAIACQVFLAAGITPVIKHLPGQGRATMDSHYDLPLVAAPRPALREIDFQPFREVLSSKGAEAVWGMVSHIIYESIDPHHPASVSSAVIDVVRQDIGFEGLLLSDDLCMNALERYGSPADRVAKTLEAGMDIALYCAGNLTDMTEFASVSMPLRDESIKRYERSKITTAGVGG